MKNGKGTFRKIKTFLHLKTKKTRQENPLLKICEFLALKGIELWLSRGQTDTDKSSIPLPAQNYSNLSLWFWQGVKHTALSRCAGVNMCFNTRYKEKEKEEKEKEKIGK